MNFTVTVCPLYADRSTLCCAYPLAASLLEYVAGVAKDQAGQVGAEASRQAKDLFHQASSELSQQAGQQQQRLAQGVRSLSDELQKMTSGQPSSGPATGPPAGPGGPI